MKTIAHIMAPMIGKAIDEETLWEESIVLTRNIMEYDEDVFKIRRELRTKINEMVADIERQIQ